MPRYVIIHGSIHQGGHQPAGGEVELTEADARKMDPLGDCLMLATKFEAIAAGDKAKAAKIAEVEQKQAEEAAKQDAEDKKKAFEENKQRAADIEKAKHHTKK